MGKLKETLAVTIALVLISTVFLWPLSLHPGRLVIANPDVFGNAWTLAWIVHQTFTNPLRLYDANIFTGRSRASWA